MEEGSIKNGPKISYVFYGKPPSLRGGTNSGEGMNVIFIFSAPLALVRNDVKMNRFRRNYLRKYSRSVN